MARRRRKKGLWGLLPELKLEADIDLWLDIIGYGLLGLALVTLLSFLSANHGAIPGWWLRLLQRTLGWGAYLMPMLAGAVGLWLVLRRFEDKLPEITPFQIAGVLVGYLTLLVTLHFVMTSFSHGGDPRAVAEDGMGGGFLGAWLMTPLWEGLGSAGMVVALVTGWAVILAVVLEITLRDAVRMIRQMRGLPAVPLPDASAALSAEQAAQTSQPASEPEEEPQRPKPPKKKPSKPEQPSGPTIASPSSSGPLRPHLLGSDQEHQLPPVDDILEPTNDNEISAKILREQARIIEEAMESLGAPVEVQEISHGPVVTQFGIRPMVVEKNGKERKVKVSRITSLVDDLALALEAKSVRLEVPIPGKRLIGLEIPNPEAEMVGLRDVITSEAFAQIGSKLRLCLGQDVSGHSIVTDLARMPHLLVAGATGSGKSICLNAIIAALLLQNTPADLRFLMIDPKRVELTGYEGIPHLLSGVVVDMERVTEILNWVLREMDGRYRRFSEVRASHIIDYNQNVAPRIGEKPLPYIVVIVDELADLMMVSPTEVERSICRIAQMARATGIHMVIATQRPSTDVVTGLIKANFPARIAFNVASAVDSRVILDLAGAEQLLGRGDMLFLPPDAPTPTRLQGTFVSDRELRRLVAYWKEEAKPKLPDEGQLVQKPLWEELAEDELAIEYEDDLLPDVIDLVLEENRASISLMQRKLRIGYNRAARLMDILVEHDVVGPQPSGGKAREIYPEAARALLHPQPQGAQGEDSDDKDDRDRPES